MSEIDERMRNWRTDRIAEYAKLENGINLQTHELVTDPERNRLIKERLLLSVRIEEVEKIYHKDIKAAKQQQAEIKLELVDTWSDTEDKTFECTAGTATLRTTKSLHIRDKEKLIHFLNLNKKLTKFIKSFDIANLRKIKDAGMLGDDIATWDEMKNMAIKIAEVNQ